MMLVFGVLGYLFKKLRYPMAPLVLALVLGDMAESSFRQSMLLSQGEVSIFFGNWLVGSLMAVSIFLLLVPMWSGLKNMLRRREASAHLG
jgi:putative tricarboxylic transport membrane protein